MGAPVSVLAQARAFARDFPRDQMPPGYLWDVLDFVPAVIDAPLTGRGGWRWASGTNLTPSGSFQTGILMPYKEGDKLYAATSTTLYEIAQTGSFDLTNRGVVASSVQNPIKYGNVVVNFGWSGSGALPQLWPYSGALAYVNAAHKQATVGTTYKAMLVTAAAPGEEHVVRFSVPNTDLTLASSFDANSFIPTSLRVTAIAALRSMILVFHAGSVERIRGATPPHGATELGDMVLEDLFDNAGTIHPKSVAYWNDNCIFADEHGVHLTDGAVIRSLTSQGNISYYWRLLYDSAISICGTVFLDYYIVTLRHASAPITDFFLGEERVNGTGAVPYEDRPPVPPIPPVEGDRPPVPPVPPEYADQVRPPVPPVPPPAVPDAAYNTTLICDLNRRQWFRVSNVNALTLFNGSGSSAMERVYAGIGGATRLVRLAPIFYPDPTVTQADDDGTVVAPRLETAWYRLGSEGRKRVRFAYLSYDVRAATGNDNPILLGYSTSPESRAYQPAGQLPSTTKYSRFRLPVYKFPYGLSFYIETHGNMNAVRFYDIAVEAQPAERSRV